MSMSVEGACVRPAGAVRITPAYDLQSALVFRRALSAGETNLAKLQLSENTWNLMESNAGNKHPHVPDAYFATSGLKTEC